jgi:hypothetical protein
MSVTLRADQKADPADGGLMPATRDFLASNPGKLLTMVLSGAAVAVAAWLVWRSFGPSADAADANTRYFVDIKTGKPFRKELKAGMRLPIDAPSGEKTGYLAELCFWNADGSQRKDPFAVVPNSALGKPEPTFCPDCGRLVVVHNPAPSGPDSKPPPKKEQYVPRRSGREQ